MLSSAAAIPKGCILVARKLDDSEVAHASPCTRELWGLILRRANYRGQKCGQTVIKRGQWLTSYEEIQELLHWRVGYRKITYSRPQIETATKWLRSRSMVTTAKATRGLFITVTNYDTYQRLDSYEHHNEDRDEDRNNAPRQRSKENKERKKGGTFVPPTPAQVDEYAASIGYRRPNLGRDFCQHYEAAGWRLKGGQPMSNWRLSVQTWRQMDERNPRRTEEPTQAAVPAPVIRDAKGLTPRERVLQEATR